MSIFLLLGNIKLPINASYTEAFSVAREAVRRAGLSPSVFEYSIYRRSVDARKKSEIFYVYSVALKGDISDRDRERLIAKGFSTVEISGEPTVVFGKEKLSDRPVIVGSGPCGLFAALLLAKNGYKPIILERGDSVADRQRAVGRLYNERTLDPDSNIQFGAGGAGTFSDGKLVTRINDPLGSYVLEVFSSLGADPAIKYIAKPHVGTDVLCKVIDNMISLIESLGGEIRYRTKFIKPISKGDKVVAVLTDKGEIPAGAVILAVGHSARDTYRTLIGEGVSLEAKNFSVGMRIEHLREDIDKALYGDFAGYEGLGAAEYNLSYNTSVRGVYTFCMCPGGVVVPAASEAGGVVVNGMSYSKRDGKNSNSAVVCSIFKEDYGSGPLAAIDFQRRIEERAFVSGGGNFSAPIITVGDFLSDKLSSEPKRILPSYMNGEGVRLASPKDYLPTVAVDGIKAALSDFGRKISGFDAPDAVLTGAETRTSAPIRITRDKESYLALGYSNLYPSGEGAGYAGGITSASVDGIKTALKLISRFAPID